MDAPPDDNQGYLYPWYSFYISFMFKYSEFLRKRVQLSPVQIFINLKFIYLLVQSFQIYFLCHIGVS